MPTLDALTLQDVLAVLGFLGALLGSAWAVWWRVTSRLHAFIEAQTSTRTAVDELAAALATSKAELAQRLDLLTRRLGTAARELNTLATLVSEREKDSARLEGQVEQLGVMIVRQVAAVNQASSSLDAIWRTLQVLHPGQVPKRASDRP